MGSQNAWDALEGFGCTGVVTAAMLKGGDAGDVFDKVMVKWVEMKRIVDVGIYIYNIIYNIYI